MQTEGARGLYKGLLPASLGSVPGVSMYFTSYEMCKKFMNSTTAVPNYLVNFASGFVAEAVSCIFWVPTDVLKERAQALSRIPIDGPGSSLRSALQTNGIWELYRGYGATLASFGPFSAFYFMIQEKLRSEWLSISNETELPFPKLALTCAVAGGAAALCTAPLDLVKVRMQVQRGSLSGSSYANTWVGLKHIFQKEGIRGLFLGAGSRVWFAVPNTAITMSVMEYVKRLIDSNSW